MIPAKCCYELPVISLCVHAAGQAEFSQQCATRDPSGCEICLQLPPALLQYALVVADETSRSVLHDLSLYKLEGIVSVVSTADISVYICAFFNSFGNTDVINTVVISLSVVAGTEYCHSQRIGMQSSACTPSWAAGLTASLAWQPA